MRAYASGASDLSAVSKAPFFEVVMRPVFRHPRRPNGSTSEIR
jgi:hypothetical protein